MISSGSNSQILTTWLIISSGSNSQILTTGLVIHSGYNTEWHYYLPWASDTLNNAQQRAQSDDTFNRNARLFKSTSIKMNNRVPSSCDRMVVGFTTTCVISAYITTKVVSSNPVHGEVYSIQHYVIKFVSD